LPIHSIANATAPQTQVLIETTVFEKATGVPRRLTPDAHFNSTIWTTQSNDEATR
jgi:hypothetical protein